MSLGNYFREFYSNDYNYNAILNAKILTSKCVLRVVYKLILALILALQNNIYFYFLQSR